MKLVSWNVNGIRAWAKKGCLEWVNEYKPDILCLQETKANAEQLDQEVRNLPGYYSYFDHSKERKGYSGVAVYSKIKPKKIEYGMGKKELDQEGRYLALYFKDFVLINVYFPNGGGGPERLKFKLDYYDAFITHAEKLRRDGLSIVFCGDINTAHKEIDLARPKENEKNTGFLPIERAWIDRVVKLGYIDTFRFFYPEKKEIYTYWDMKTYSRDRNVGWRIDYFYVSSDLKSRLKEAQILDSVLGSDHCPIGLELK